MRKIIILRSAGNELANQIWNYASYAYVSGISEFYFNTDW